LRDLALCRRRRRSRSRPHLSARAPTPCLQVRFFDGRYRLIDFDNTRKRGAAAAGTTPAICPPELARAYLAGAPSKAEFATDFWALGCLLYQMVAGRPLIHDLLGGEGGGGEEEAKAADGADGQGAAVAVEAEAPAGEKEGEGGHAARRRRLLAPLAALRQEGVDALLEALGAAGRRGNVAVLRQARELLSALLRVEPRERAAMTLRAARESPYVRGTDTSTMKAADNRDIKGALASIGDGVAGVAADVAFIRARVVTIEERTAALSALPDAVQAQLRGVRAALAGLRGVVIGLAERQRCPTTFVVLPELAAYAALGGGGAGAGAAARAEAQSRIWGGLKSWATDVGDFLAAAKPVVWFDQHFCDRRLVLMLLCEGCGKRMGPGYRITAPGTTMAKLAPALKARGEGGPGRGECTARRPHPPPPSPDQHPPD
jgi:hypothetical protein